TGGTITSYQVEYKSTGSWTTVTSSVTSKTLTGLAATTYQFRVRAVNATGAGSYSLTVTVGNTASDLSKMQTMDPSKMQGGAGMMATTDPPELENLLILNFGPYDATNGTSGDFEFFEGFAHRFFDEFGNVHSPGTPKQYDNPTFEYKVPRNTKVYLPISGVVDWVTWQPTASYTQNDWELAIKPTRASNWAVVIDHVVAITCDRSKLSVCDDKLTVNGVLLEAGSQVKAGDLLGYVGNYDNGDGTGVFGRTEITIGEYVKEGGQLNFMNYCPTNYLKSDVKVKIRAAVNE
ncbi:MAG TPA: hypothetical protein EYQ00_00820, partial [Dehalococcoidia bacterium]|nr:hypothetical protein [Dehalococcoidia bacterium]